MFVIPFLLIFGSRLDPAGSPNWLRDVPETLQILPKSPPCLKKCPDRLPGGSGKVPGHSQDQFFDEFSLIFESVFSTKSSSDIYDFIKFVNGLTKEIS